MYVCVCVCVCVCVHVCVCVCVRVCVHVLGHHIACFLFTKELTLVTKPGEGFGFAICGGLNGYPGNPLDETDEGIFISQVGGIVWE